MSKLFGGGGKAPPPPVVPEAPAPAPTVDDAAKVREMRDQTLRRRGRAASILTGSKGAGAPTVAVKTLTGE